MTIAPQVTRKLLWYFFVLSISAYIMDAILIEKYVLMDSTGGFIYENGTELPSTILYSFSAVSFVLFGIQFQVPKWIANELVQSIVRYALCEAIAIFGFLLFLFGGDFQKMLLFLGLSLIGFISTYPKQKTL